MSRYASSLRVLALVPFTSADDKKKDDKKDELKLSAEEQAVLDLTNAERKKIDLKPLAANPQLMEAARKHAENMAKQDKLDHILDEKSPSDRTKAAGYKSGFVGENIAHNYKDAKAVVAGWMNSEGAPREHPENRLRRDRRRGDEEREGRTVLGAGVRQTVGDTYPTTPP